MRSTRTGHQRIIIDGDRAFIYDLRTDPRELKPTVMPLEEIADLMKLEPKARQDAGSEFRLDEEALRALGYVH